MGKYGVFIGDDEVNVQFGDGKTGIQSLGFEDGCAGVVLCRDGKHNEPFGLNENKDTYKSKEDKVFLRFENSKSIDVLIARLKEAKEYIKL